MLNFRGVGIPDPKHASSSHPGGETIQHPGAGEGVVLMYQLKQHHKVPEKSHHEG